MTHKQIKQILRDTGYIHTGGSEEERTCAQYLLMQVQALGVDAKIEPFAVPMGAIRTAKVIADGKEIPCEGYRLCGSHDVTAPFLYLPNTDGTSVALAKDRIVMLDGYLRHFTYLDLYQAGAKGIVTYNGSRYADDDDIDSRELRDRIREGAVLLPAANIHVNDAVKLVKNGTKEMRIQIDQTMYEGESANIVCTLPGETERVITLVAHYDSSPLSVGAYDNMSGCIGLLGIMEALCAKPHRHTLRFVFCGSEERGLLGSHAYVAAHPEEIEKTDLLINLDMIGCYMGRFIACCTSEEALVSYLSYMGAELGWGIEPRQGVYSSDSTPFADKGVPAVSFARLAPQGTAGGHNRFDLEELLSPAQLTEDIRFITEFTRRMADSVRCPVQRVMPENMKTELDQYLGRERKK